MRGPASASSAVAVGGLPVAVHACRRRRAPPRRGAASGRSAGSRASSASSPRCLGRRRLAARAGRGKPVVVGRRRRLDRGGNRGGQGRWRTSRWSGSWASGSWAGAWRRTRSRRAIRSGSIAHRKREAVDDLVTRGAREVTSLAEMAAEADVDRALRHRLAGGRGDGGGARAGGAGGADDHRQLDLGAGGHRAAGGGAGAARGSRCIDAPLSRTPAARLGRARLTTFVGGPAELVERWRPLLATWASAVIPVGGPVGSAHAMKLINNLVALGYAAIWAECYAMVAQGRRRAGGLPRGGVELGDELRQLPELLEVSGRRRPERAQVHASPTPSRT